MFSIDDYNYDLPLELIAQQPLARRDQSRLMVLNRKDGRIAHCRFYDLCDFLLPSDVLVVNNTKVIPARLVGHKDSGGKAEILLLDYTGSREKIPDLKTFRADCLIKASKRPKPGSSILFDEGLTAKVLSASKNIFSVEFRFKGGFEDIMYQIGKVPLPPYIKRDRVEHSDADDRTNYQTVYASCKGAIAAPTAGFHFSADLLKKIKAKGIRLVEITLHIGYGTFLPVRESDIRKHKMHSEWYSISRSSAEVVSRAKTRGDRIIAVGTTCVRTLEHRSNDSGVVSAGSGSCDLFIYPGYRFKSVDAMVTNFHLPRSTLLMLISAFAGRRQVFEAYQEAIRQRYRFYSYGDAMFIT